MRNKYRYFITDQLFTNEEVFPIGESGLKEDYTPYGGYIADFKHEIKGNLTFIDETFNHFYSLETSNLRCKDITIVIQKYCGTTWSDYYSGVLSLSKAEWDWEKCRVSMPISSMDDYYCYNNKKGTEIDLMPIVPNRVVAKLIAPNTTLEYINYSTTSIKTPFEYWGGTGNPSTQGWTLWKHIYYIDGTVHHNDTYWVREKRIEPCANPDLVAPWILTATACPGTGKTYVRKATVYNPQIVQYYDSVGVVNDYSKTFTILGAATDTAILNVDNGMLFREVLPAIANICGLTVVSDFFQINPENPSANNPITQEISKTSNLIVYQKSDVKRPRDLNNASKCIVKPGDFIDRICGIFNLRYQIDGSTFRIEHFSFFQQGVGLDLTLLKYAKWVFKKHRYNYDSNEMPRIERFRYSEFTQSSDFEESVISYENNCASREEDGDVKMEVDGITTDLLLCLNNPGIDSKVVDDAGIFLMATEEVGGEYHLITESGVRYPIAPNNSLAWDQLVRDYHKWNRPFKTGKVNNTETTFNLVRPTKKGQILTIPLGCEDVFSPFDKVKTVLGDGYVKQSSLDLSQNALSLTLAYSADDNLTINQPPVANPDSTETFKNVTADINVMANDSDPDGIGTITLLEIVTPPGQGTATVLPDKRVRYVPNTDYIGYDSFYYRIKDDAGNYSNTALCVIQILDPTPIAVNDSYKIVKGTSKTFASVLNNDFKGEGATLMLVVANSATALGQPLTMSTDGTFNYTAPATAGFDSFTYTLRNDLSIEATGTVNIEIIEPPVANPFTLAKSLISKAESCARYGNPIYHQVRYSSSTILGVGSVLYDDSGMTVTAYYGWYSDGSKSYFIPNSDGIITVVQTC